MYDGWTALFFIIHTLKLNKMETPKWFSGMSDAQYLAYVLACKYLDITPHSRYSPY